MGATKGQAMQPREDARPPAKYRFKKRRAPRRTAAEEEGGGEGKKGRKNLKYFLFNAFKEHNYDFLSFFN